MVAIQERRVPKSEAIFAVPAAEAAPKRRQRPVHENSTEKAIKEIKQLVTLKLDVQRLREQATAVRQGLGVLFSDEDIAAEQAEQLLAGIETLAEYVRLKRQYREARERARPALALLDESEVGEDEILEFN